MTFKSVDFPLPDGPKMVHISPFSTVMATPRKTSTLPLPSPKLLVKPETSKYAMNVTSLSGSETYG